MEADQPMRSGKTSGANNIPAKNFKMEGTSVLSCSLELITQCWDQEEVPQDWKNTSIVTIFNEHKGNRQTTITIVVYPTSPLWVFLKRHVTMSHSDKQWKSPVSTIIMPNLFQIVQ